MEGDTEILPGFEPGTPPCLIRHRYSRVNGVRLHYVEAEPTRQATLTVKGSGIVCALHGFPEFWYSWRHQLPALAGAGLHALAPDLRGYNDSDKPRGVESYRLAALVEDVAGLIQIAGGRRACVVGHDWGGVIAWALAMRRPEVVERLAVLNAPHPAAFLRELRTPRQLLRSWYTFFFQLPRLPERFLRRGNYAGLERILRHEPARPGAFSDADIRSYKQALDRPGALTAAINYYRAAFRHRGRMGRHIHPITVPTLLIWGERDRYLGRRLTEGLEPWVPNLRIARLPGVSHWVQNDAPDEVNRLLVGFLTQDRGVG
jgi:pimeloyl-ACP methyl ester carboxylesterase